MNRAIRTFFEDRSYTEVDTPILSPTLIPEATIENFSTRFENPFLPSKDLYLVPSPEIFMKQLIAEGIGSIYQISHCFRNSEQLGNIHNIEFSMLEYYTIGADEQDSITLTEDLVASLLSEDSPQDLKPPFRRMSVEEAMLTYAGIDLKQHQRQSSLAKEAQRLGLSLPPGPESWEDTFNRIFLTFVEPNLPKTAPWYWSSIQGRSPALQRLTVFTDGGGNCTSEVWRLPTVMTRREAKTPSLPTTRASMQNWWKTGWTAVLSSPIPTLPLPISLHPCPSALELPWALIAC